MHFRFRFQFPPQLIKDQVWAGLMLLTLNGPLKPGLLLPVTPIYKINECVNHLFIIIINTDDAMVTLLTKEWN